MSLTTWKEEFYPIPASRFMSELEAVQHSLKKWRGLRPGELSKHDVTIGPVNDRQGIRDKIGSGLVIDSTTCALCEINREGFESINCRNCVLYRIRPTRHHDFRHRFPGGMACDEGEGASPYAAFSLINDPEPMIALLERALAHLEYLPNSDSHS